LSVRNDPGQTPDPKQDGPKWLPSRPTNKSFRNVAVSDTKHIQSILQKFNFSDAQVLHLDRTKPKGNRTAAKAFAAKIDKALSAFQDSDMILIALTVKHKR
jgi:hypothetical protein